jgi:hypothetical protein
MRGNGRQEHVDATFKLVTAVKSGKTGLGVSQSIESLSLLNQSVLEVLILTLGAAHTAITEGTGVISRDFDTEVIALLRRRRDGELDSDVGGGVKHGSAKDGDGGLKVCNTID